MSREKDPLVQAIEESGEVIKAVIKEFGDKNLEILELALKLAESIDSLRSEVSELKDRLESVIEDNDLRVL